MQGNVFALLQEDVMKKARKEEKKREQRAQKEKERREQAPAEPQISAEELEKAIFSQQVNISNWADEDDEEEEAELAAQQLQQQQQQEEEEAEPGWSKVWTSSLCAQLLLCMPLCHTRNCGGAGPGVHATSSTPQKDFQNIQTQAVGGVRQPLAQQQAAESHDQDDEESEESEEEDEVCAAE